MRKINLYKYDEEDGTTIITPIQRTNKDKPYKYRLLADENMELYNGKERFDCVDIKLDDIELWMEIEKMVIKVGV